MSVDAETAALLRRTPARLPSSIRGYPLIVCLRVPRAAAGPTRCAAAGSSGWLLLLCFVAPALSSVEPPDLVQPRHKAVLVHIPKTGGGTMYELLKHCPSILSQSSHNFSISLAAQLRRNCRAAPPTGPRHLGCELEGRLWNRAHRGRRYAAEGHPIGQRVAEPRGSFYRDPQTPRH